MICTLKSPLCQALLLTILSIIIGISANIIRVDRIPWLAPKIEKTESVSVNNSSEPIIATISLKQAKELFDLGVLFIDARDEEYYSKGHIEKAWKNGFLLELVFNIDAIQGKNTPIVVYCGDEGCGSSDELAYELQSQGFNLIYVFKGGWMEWTKANYPTEIEQ